MPDRHPGWFDAFRQLVQFLQVSPSIVLFTQRTTAGFACARAAARLDLPACRVVLHAGPANFSRTGSPDSSQVGQAPSDVHAFPLLANPLPKPASVNWPAAEDELLLHLSHVAMVLSLNRAGRVARLLRTATADHELAQRYGIPPLIYWGDPQRAAAFQVLPGLQRSACYLQLNEHLPSIQQELERSWAQVTQPAQVDSVRDWSAGRLTLTHCTRRCRGPWPGESREDYQDSLLLSRPSADHSAFATLLRILDAGCIRGSSAAIRGSYPVVCFTELTPSELISARTFQRHRGHWDFEFYGLVFRRDWLELRGARRVTYGNGETWDSLDARSRPWFQASQTARGQDWTWQREWRSLGDLRFDRNSGDLEAVLVHRRSEAVWLSQFMRCPIVYGHDA